MTPTNVTDCLVLKLEENDVDTHKIDNTIYIIYDTYVKTYIIRGRRGYDSSGINGTTYSFSCDCELDVVDYLEYMICNKNTVNEILYNYTDLPAESNEIWFEDLHNDALIHREISGYNNKKIKRKRLLRILRMIKNVFNYYN